MSVDNGVETSISHDKHESTNTIRYTHIHTHKLTHCCCDKSDMLYLQNHDDGMESRMK